MRAASAAAVAAARVVTIARAAKIQKFDTAPEQKGSGAPFCAPVYASELLHRKSITVLWVGCSAPPERSSERTSWLPGEFVAAAAAVVAQLIESRAAAAGCEAKELFAP